MFGVEGGLAQAVEIAWPAELEIVDPGVVRPAHLLVIESHRAGELAARGSPSEAYARGLVQHRKRTGNGSIVWFGCGARREQVRLGLRLIRQNVANIEKSDRSGNMKDFEKAGLGRVGP